LKDSNRVFYNLLKDCWIRRWLDNIVEYVDDLIVVDRSIQRHVSKQSMECIQKHWKVNNEGTLTRYEWVLIATRKNQCGPLG
jgi:hypothetical protein